MEKRVFAQPERISSPTTQKTLNERKGSSIRIGDVVLVQEILPISRWRLALVEKLIEGRDVWCQAAQVKLTNGNRIEGPFSCFSR